MDRIKNTERECDLFYIPVREILCKGLRPVWGKGHSDFKKTKDFKYLYCFTKWLSRQGVYI